jgi:hypothetical protein
MTDPTPEERARKHCDSPFHDTREGLCSYCELLSREIRDACVAEVNLYIEAALDRIRAAVEAETERCAERCESGGMVNGDYFAAAIRNRGESDAD